MSTMTNDNLIDQFREIAQKIADLKTQRTEISNGLRSAAIEADEETRQELQGAAAETRKALADLDSQIANAEAHKARLDTAVDAGSDDVEDMDLFSATTTVRRLRGKRKKAASEAEKAERALKPFLSDDHLALLAADTFETLVDVPVLVRKRPADVRGIGDAIVVSQNEPTEGYGTVGASGRVRFTEMGNTGLDLEALEDALKETGSEVFVSAGMIDFEQALWPVTPLIRPSASAVAQFADVLERSFDATLKRGGKKAGNSYADYKAIWHTIEASLDVPEPGVAKGKVIAVFGVDGEYAPLYQMEQFVKESLSHFQIGGHTTAGVFEGYTIEEVKDLGPWVPEGQPQISGRRYDGKFGVSISLDYRYTPVEEV